MGHRAHRLLLVLLSVGDASHTVPAHLHDDSADLVQQFLFAGRLRERLIAGTQGTQRPIQPSKLLVDLAVAIAGANLGRTRIGTRSCGHLRALARRRGAWVFRIRFRLRQEIAGQPILFEARPTIVYIFLCCSLRTLLVFQFPNKILNHYELYNRQQQEHGGKHVRTRADCFPRSPSVSSPSECKEQEKAGAPRVRAQGADRCSRDSPSGR